MPVWTGGKELLEEEFGGESQNRKISFSGFGGRLWGDLYSVTLSVADLIFNHMSIIVSNNLGITPYQLIMSATMFDHLTSSRKSPASKLPRQKRWVGTSLFLGVQAPTEKLR